MRKPLIYVWAFAALLTSAGGCYSGSTGDAGSVSIPIKTAKEMEPVKSVDILGRTIVWAAADAPGDWGDQKEAERVVGAAISGRARQLVAVDYVSLSLPAFLTQTKALALDASDFTGQAAYIDARGADSDGKKWLLYAWKGPEFPKHPDRPIVFRWVYVYALYSVEVRTVDRIIATIGGEVQE